MTLETGRFFSIMRRFFLGYTDEFWGPIYGPGGPHMRRAPNPEPWRHSPTPEPWRELGIAYEVVRLAEVFEVASEGMGISFLRKFADDPDELCPRWPRWPHPHKDEERLLDPAVLGAALDFIAEGVANATLADTARELGREMAGSEV
jgi:hypothetical protein